MGKIRVPIGNDGPVIDLGIWISRAMAHASVAQGSPIPSPMTVRALIDTARTKLRSIRVPWH